MGAHVIGFSLCQNEGPSTVKLQYWIWRLWLFERWPRPCQAFWVLIYVPSRSWKRRVGCRLHTWLTFIRWYAHDLETSLEQRLLAGCLGNSNPPERDLSHKWWFESMVFNLASLRVLRCIQELLSYSVLCFLFQAKANATFCGWDYHGFEWCSVQYTYDDLWNIFSGAFQQRDSVVSKHSMCWKGNDCVLI